VLPWLWHRPEAAALIPPLAWELPYAAGVVLKRKQKTKEVKKKNLIRKIHEVGLVCMDAQVVHCSQEHSLTGKCNLEPSPCSTGQASGQAGATLSGEKNRDGLHVSCSGAEP